MKRTFRHIMWAILFGVCVAGIGDSLSHGNWIGGFIVFPVCTYKCAEKWWKI